jgi:hypothetical protein
MANFLADFFAEFFLGLVADMLVSLCAWLRRKRRKASEGEP